MFSCIARAGLFSVVLWTPTLTLWASRASTLPDLPSPSTGWLIISGPPAAGVSCAITRAYDVGTGAAFVLDGCADRASAGRVPSAIVRDALAELVSRRDRPWSPGSRPLRHTWRWVVNDSVSVIGDLPWLDPKSPGAGDMAVRRVRAVDASLVGGCAPHLPPPSLVLVATLPRMVNPVSADASQELNVRYRTARERWARLPACAVPSR